MTDDFTANRRQRAWRVAATVVVWLASLSMTPAWAQTLPPVTPEPTSGTDYWASHNKDGHWRNASDMSISGVPRVRWARVIDGLHPHSYQMVPPFHGQRSNNISVRNGGILLVVPDNNPAANSSLWHYASFGIYSLATGNLTSRVLSPHYGAGALMTAAGRMDSDTPSGILTQYWNANNVAFTAYGGDFSTSFHFIPQTGGPSGLPVPSTVFLAGGSNSSGYFAMSNANPLIYYKGGGAGHSSFDGGEGAGLIGYDTVGPQDLFSSAMKMYSSVVVDGNWVYPMTVTNVTNPNVPDPNGPGYGVRITGTEVQPAPYGLQFRWTYTDSTKSFLGFGSDHTSGAPRAYTLAEDGHLYYYGYNTIGASPNWAAGTLLVSIPTAGSSNPRLSDFNIPVTGYNPAAENTYTALPLHTQLAPQIATRSRYVVVFQPQQTGQNSQATVSNGHLFAFDTTSRTLIWRADFPASYFITNTQMGDGFRSPEQAVQMTIAGDSAYIVEPYASSGQLRIRVERFLLTNGTRTTTVLDPVDAAGQPIAVTQSELAMREVAAVDGTLTCLIDTGVLSQALVVIDGGSGQQPPQPPQNLRIVP